MNYEHILTGTFLSRPNRFIAHVDLKGRVLVCHVKNTGRCRELLVPGTTVILEYHPNAAALGRKTEYDLIGVYKDKLLINMDSQAPNRAAWEWMEAMKGQAFPGPAPVSGSAAGTHEENPWGMGAPSRIPLWTPEGLRREVTHGDSRFDLAFTLAEINGGRQVPALMEVKGVTLEKDGMTLFPDAPTLRGVKHLEGLAAAVGEGYETYILFVIQMKGIKGFKPNDATHPEFGDALRAAASRGVHVLAYDCIVTPGTMTVDKPVPVLLDGFIKDA